MEDNEYFEEDDDIDIDIVDDINSNNNNINDTEKKTIVQLNKEIKLSLLLSQKEILIKYLKNINIDNELVQLLNENINLVISNQFNKENNNKNNNNNNKPISTNQCLNIDNEYIKHTQTFLSESVSNYHKLNNKDSIICNKQLQPYESNKIDKFQVKRFKRVHEKSIFQIPIQHNDTVQITAPKEEIEKRIKTFNALKKSENGKYNIIEFIDEDSNGGSTLITGSGEDKMSGTSRCLAVPPSKMKVTKAYNLTGPLDHHDTNSSMIQQPSIDDRLSILENHLKLVVPPVPIDIYQRVKLIEQKMLSLEDKNPVLFKDLYDEMKQNSTVVHTNKVLKTNINNNNNNNNNTNTTNNSNSSTTTTTSPPNIFTIKFKK